MNGIPRHHDIPLCSIVDSRLTNVESQSQIGIGGFASPNNKVSTVSTVP